MGALRKSWLDTALDKAAASVESLSHASEAIALAMVPAKPAPFYGPINIAGAEVVDVPLEPVDVVPPKGRVPDEATSAMRSYLAGAHEWGPERRVSVMLADASGIRCLVIEGREGAIRHAIPDAETIKAWKAAGAVSFPVVLNPGDLVGRRVTYVSLDRLPAVLQVEVASRSSAS